MGKQVSDLQATWRKQVMHFRRYLTEQKLNIVDVVHSSDYGPFLTSLDMSDVRSASIGGMQECECDKSSTRPVVDFALVVPMEMNKYAMTWGLMESLRQLTVFPKEIIFVIGNTGRHKPVELISLVGLIRDFYTPDIPDLCRVRVFASPLKANPGDSRWFGFNHTSADIVTLFDNDDYIHPQFFHIFWRLFSQRPELDLALMQYESADAMDACSENMFFSLIGQFLHKRTYSETEIETGLSFPMSKYEELWGMIPTFDKEWWLGNTDAEPNWSDNPDQQWWDMGCHNGWSIFRRYVMEMIPPPVGKFGGEDAIWNYRVARSKFNYRCIELAMGAFLKSYCIP